MRITPRAKEPKRVAGCQRDAPRVKVPSLACRAGNFDHCLGKKRKIKPGCRIVPNGKLESTSPVISGIVYQQSEFCCFTGEYRIGAARRDAQGDQIAESMHHGNKTESGKQENQCMAETQAVVDGTEQHDDQGQCEEQPAARRHDEDAALAEAQRCCSVAAPAKKKLLETSGEVHGSGNGNAAQQAGDVFGLCIAALLGGA